MLNSLTIENFRGFRAYTLPELTRINLLVGKNNCGKTSMLEAIQLLASRHGYSALSTMLYRRGEYLADWAPGTDSLPIVASHLFYGHEVNVDSSVSGDREFQIHGKFGDQSEQLRCVLRPSTFWKAEKAETPVNGNGPMNDSSAFLGVELALQWKVGQAHWEEILEVVGHNQLSGTGAGPVPAELRTRIPVIMLSAESIREDWPLEAFEGVQLTLAEDDVIRAVQKVDSRIERIATTSRDLGSRSGGVRYRFFVKLKGSEGRLPMGVLGDGVWHAFLLGLAMVRAKGGLLLVDDIDTGLHYSTMADLWRFVSDLSSPDNLDVQVFATTHSRDCFESLAEVIRDNVAVTDTVSIHRIEAGLDAPVSFRGEDIRYVADHELEVR